MGSTGPRLAAGSAVLWLLVGSQVRAVQLFCVLGVCAISLQCAGSVVSEASVHCVIFSGTFTHTFTNCRQRQRGAICCCVASADVHRYNSSGTFTHTFTNCRQRQRDAICCCVASADVHRYNSAPHSHNTRCLYEAWLG